MKVRHLSHLSVHHSDALDEKYEVAEKAFPPDLLPQHGTYQGQPVHWIANFGYVHKGTRAAPPETLEEAYDIELAAQPQLGAQLVYFDGSAVQPLATRPSDATPGKLKATLNLGDPPIGWTTR
jgi:hypothetical protein